MELKAGRELDALVAEKIMGWSVVEVPKRFGIVERHLVAPGEPHEQNTVAEYINGHTVASCLPSQFLPHYSTSIADAWTVVEKLDGQWTLEGNEGIGWDAKFYSSTGGMDAVVVSVSATADTASHVICLAALKAVANEKT